MKKKKNRTDKERLDWLERNSRIFPTGTTYYLLKPLRESIDAAMDEDWK